jgi:hypothetical protein
LAIVFFSTCISKLKYFKSHLKFIISYNLLPNKVIPFFLKLIIALEGVIVLTLLTNYLKLIGYIIAIILLSIYTFAIIINLIRANNIECGCGGIVGNKQISWITFLRNIFLLVLFGFLLMGNIYKGGYILENYFNMYVGMFLICLYLILITGENLSNMFKRLQE